MTDPVIEVIAAMDGVARECGTCKHWSGSQKRLLGVGVCFVKLNGAEQNPTVSVQASDESCAEHEWSAEAVMTENGGSDGCNDKL